jgi:phosphatidylinositol-3-phosphatase
MFMAFRIRLARHRSGRPLRRSQMRFAKRRTARAWHSDRVFKSAATVMLVIVIAAVVNSNAPGSRSPSSGNPSSSQAVAINSTLGDDRTLTPPRQGRPSSTPTAAAAVAPTHKATPASTSTPQPAAVHRAAAPSSTPHVMVIMEENKGYQASLGTCSADPYYCSLAAAYATDTSWFGISHPSAPNYVSMVSGATQGVSSDCTPPGCGPFNVPSLGGQLTAAGIPWRAYMESMAAPCSSSGSTGLYAEKHNPFLYFNDVRAASNCATVDVPYPGAAGLVSALTGPGAPDFVWITPNLANDMHNGSVSAGDAWLKANLAPVLASSWFAGANATVIVTMDENDAQSTPGGGQVPMVVISSSSHGVGVVSSHGNHFGTLRSIEEEFGLGLLGGAASSANGDLNSLFGGPK